jgi:hypothetical protein
MNLIFESENIGAFAKWLKSGFRHKYRDELNGEHEHYHFIKQLSIETENKIIGFMVLLILFILIIVAFDIFGH